MMEQMIQLEEGQTNPELIAGVYKDWSAKALRAAQILAQNDAELAREAMEERKKISLRSFLIAPRRLPSLRRVAGSAA